MAASRNGGGGAAAVEFKHGRSFESIEIHDDAAEEIRSLICQTQRRPISRLQKQAPAKMFLKRLSPDSMGFSCRSPIPFLSPILVSPLGGGGLDRLLFTEKAERQNQATEESVVNAVIPTKGWQHPAGPFFAESVCSFSQCFAELCTQP